MTITGDLADILVKTRFEDIPGEAVEVARQVCLDGVGVMIAGAREPLGLGRLVIDYTREIGGAQDAHVIAGGFKTSVLSAAYANGTLGHALDFDNTWPPLNHPTSPTLPAILALSERDGLSGRDMLLAIVLAFEVQGRMRLASHRIRAGTHFHKPGVSGLMGAVTAAGKLLGLDAGQFRMAFGIGGSRAGSMSANTGTMTKSSHSGHAARMGVEAAMLARMGWTAHDDIFGAGNFFSLFYKSENCDLDLFLKDFGNPYRMVEPGVGFKKHPCNYFTHRPIDAALALVAAHDLKAEDIDRVAVDFPQFPYVSRPVPKSGLDGKFSVEYTLSLAFLDRGIRVESFSDNRRFAPDVEAMLPRIEMNFRAEIPNDFEETYAVVRVTTKDGRQLEERCDKPRGLWGVPLTRDERLEKFRGCAGPVLPPGDVDRLIELIEGIDALPSAAPIMEIATRAESLS